MTSGTRRIVPVPVGEGHVYASMYGLCGSKSSGSGLPVRSANSAKLPSTSTSVASSSLIHTGNGEPQYRSREIAQSTLFDNHSPKRPLPISDGFQLTAALRAIRSSLTAVVRTNHEPRA